MTIPRRSGAFDVVKSAAGPHGSSERAVFVFQCYLDDSGTSGLPVVTMAGFVAATQQWEHLEPAFDEIMTRYSVPLLHAKDFKETRGPFKGWSKIKKRAFAEELFTMAHGRMYGVSMSVAKQRFLELRRDDKNMHNASAYGTCFSAIIFHLAKNPLVGPQIRNHGLAFLVETGNKNNGELDRSFNEMAKHKHFSEMLRGLTFVPKTSCRSIQIADFFAYFSRRYMRDNERFKGKVSLPRGLFLDIIFNNVPVWQSAAFGDFLMVKGGPLDDMPEFGTTFWDSPDEPTQSG